MAERQGQTVARNMLGQGQRFSDVPFFWSQHYDVPINYLGHAENWDELDIEGDVRSRDCLVRYRRNGKVVAVASIFRDLDNLKEEVSMEHAGSHGNSRICFSRLRIWSQLAATYGTDLSNIGRIGDGPRRPYLGGARYLRLLDLARPENVKNYLACGDQVIRE